jgi:hypothetical protein
MAAIKINKHRTRITIGLENGKIVDVEGEDRASVTKVTPREFEKVFHSKAGFRYVSTMLYDEQDGMCCYWIPIGGKWIKVCVPC